MRLVLAVACGLFGLAVLAGAAAVSALGAVPVATFTVHRAEPIVAAAPSVAPSVAAEPVVEPIVVQAPVATPAAAPAASPPASLKIVAAATPKPSRHARKSPPPRHEDRD